MSEQPTKEAPRQQRKKPLAQLAAENSPLIPTQWTNADALAMQRFAAGAANGEEQKLAFAWIMRCCGLNEEPYRPGGEDGRRDTDFALGKQSVGRQLMKLVKINLSRLRGGADGEHG